MPSSSPWCAPALRFAITVCAPERGKCRALPQDLSINPRIITQTLCHDTGARECKIAVFLWPVLLAILYVADVWLWARHENGNSVLEKTAPKMCSENVPGKVTQKMFRFSFGLLRGSRPVLSCERWKSQILTVSDQKITIFTTDPTVSGSRKCFDRPKFYDRPTALTQNAHRPFPHERTSREPRTIVLIKDESIIIDHHPALYWIYRLRVKTPTESL